MIAAAIFLGALLATAGWVVSNRYVQILSRRQHTFTIYNGYRLDNKFLENLDHVKNIFRANNVPEPGDGTRARDIESLDWLLNHYEFISAAVLNGDIDEKLIRTCEYSRMKKLYEGAREYIRKDRTAENQPTMHKNLEDLVARWECRPHTRAARFYEMVMLRPCVEEPRWLTWLNHIPPKPSPN